MSQTKWNQVYTAHHGDEAYANYFKENLYAHLSSKADPSLNKHNQAEHVLDGATKCVAMLTRIFDEFNFPVPSYEDMKKIWNDTSSLRNHLQEKINQILPILLNKDRTALHNDVIKAIGEKYGEILKHTTAENIAKSFVEAAVISYGQRILDNAPGEQKTLVSQNLLMPIEQLSKTLTLNGLPEISAPKVQNISQLKTMLKEFKNLIAEGKNAFGDDFATMLPSLINIEGSIYTANSWFDMKEMSEEVILSKSIESYDIAVNKFLYDAKSFANKELQKPEEAYWFVKILRFITGNEKFLQNTDEKRFSKQSEFLSATTALETQFRKIAEDEQEPVIKKGI